MRWTGFPRTILAIALFPTHTFITTHIVDVQVAGKTRLRDIASPYESGNCCKENCGQNGSTYRSDYNTPFQKNHSRNNHAKASFRPKLRTTRHAPANECAPRGKRARQSAR